METSKMISNRRQIVGAAIAIIVALTCGAVYGSQFRIEWSEAALFAEAVKLMDQASELKADILSPTTYAKAMLNTEKAKLDYNQGKKLSEIRKQLSSAIIGFQGAINQAKTAQVHFASTMQARHDALKAEAHFFVPKKWAQAENKLKQAAQILEKEAVREARKPAEEATRLYREAELQAIKENILGHAYQLLEDAEKLKIKQHAPKTLQKAQELVKLADKELNENREDTDKARDLARQARREARHAIYLGTTIRMIVDKIRSIEDVLIDSEVPLRKIAKAMDVTLTFEEGFNKATEEMVKKVTTFTNEREKLSNDLFDARRMTSMLRARTDELEIRLGGAQKAKSMLSQHLEAYEKIRLTFRDVEKLFTADEASIFREGNDLRIRLTGLNFPVGKAVIDSKYYPFLGKVIKAIRLFPNANITVEGHTDSYGSDETNSRLSMDRATGVMTYLMENMPVDKTMIDAIGFGETRPIASNETEEGRAKNRRIAVVIHPNLGQAF